MHCGFLSYSLVYLTHIVDVVAEAVDTTPSVPSFKQHTWSFLPSSHRLFDHLFAQNY